MSVSTWAFGMTVSRRYQLVYADHKRHVDGKCENIQYIRFQNYPYQNVGDMNNKGWEINLNTNKLIQKGKFWMDLNFTFATTRMRLPEWIPVYWKL